MSSFPSEYGEFRFKIGDKNAPGINYSIPPEGFREVGPEGPEITPAPEDRNEGDFKNDGFTSTALRRES